MMLMASGVTARAREPRLQAELDQDAAGIGRELQAGAGFLQPLGLFQHDDAKALCGERQRRRQSPDPGTSDDDGARDAPPRRGQATLSFSTHSGGRASPAARSAAKRYSVEQ